MNNTQQVSHYHQHLNTSPPNRPLNRLLDNPDNLIRIPRIKRHHMLRAMIIVNRLTRLTKPIQLHALRIQRIQLAHDIRRRDRNRIRIRLRLDTPRPRAIPGQPAAEKHRGAEQRRRVRVCLAVVCDHRRGERGALREAHHRVEGAFLGDCAVGVLEGFVEVGAWEAGGSWVVAVERAFDYAFEFCVRVRVRC